MEDDDDNEEHHGHRELSATSEAAMSDTGLDRQAATPQIPQQPTPPPDHVGEKPLRPVDETLDAPEEAPDGAIEEVRKSRRLFLRNLPYTTSEDDIRELFQSYGNLQEVGHSPSFPAQAIPLQDVMMNCQIGTAYFKYDVNLGELTSRCYSYLIHHIPTYQVSTFPALQKLTPCHPLGTRSDRHKIQRLERHRICAV